VNRAATSIPSATVPVLLIEPRDRVHELRLQSDQGPEINLLEAVGYRILYSVPCGSPYDNYGEGRRVCAWCNGRFAFLEMITKHVPFGRIVLNSRSGAGGGFGSCGVVRGLRSWRVFGGEQPLHGVNLGEGEGSLRRHWPFIQPIA
jgi:hypothetical protein